MKKTLVISILVWIVSLSSAQASLSSYSSGARLYEVFNHFFYNEDDAGRFKSDLSLLNRTEKRPYFMENGSETTWGQAGDIFRVDVTYRDARLDQRLGFMDDSGYHDLLGYADVKNHRYRSQGVTFEAVSSFMWTDTIGYMGGDLQRWYSDQAANPFGGEDHFLAFSIQDQNLLDVYNSRFGTSYDAKLDQVWMLAFEGLNLGDADYTDLVAVVSRPSDLNPVPLPGTVLLFGSAVAGLAASYRRGRSSRAAV